MVPSTMQTGAKISLFFCILFGVLGLLAHAASKFLGGLLIVCITAAGLLGFVMLLTLLVRKQKNPRAKFRLAGMALLGAVMITYAILVPLVYFYQDTIASQKLVFFQPKTISPDTAQALLSSHVEALDLAAPDGVHLRGWLVHNASSTPAPLLIYFGGSSSESSEVLPYAQQLAGWSVALVNYRGFGLSQGTPSLEAVLADAVFTYDSLAQRPDIDPSRIAVMGYSLGTGVAIHLAYQRPLEGVLLAAPYDRFTMIGVKRPLIYAPLSGILKPYFSPISLVPHIQAPMLCLIGTFDLNIPNSASRDLAGQWGGEVTLKVYQRENHGLLFHQNSSWADINRFLNDIERK